MPVFFFETGILVRLHYGFVLLSCFLIKENDNLLVLHNNPTAAKNF